MTFNNTRPPFVVAFMADNQGCGYHRIQTPLASLVEQGVADGRIDMSAWPDHVALGAKPDVIIWQRPVDDGQIDAMARYRKMLPDALFVYELDDYLGEIPPASFHAGFMPPNIEAQVVKGLALCDRVTTTTEEMATWLRSLNDQILVQVVPNAIPVAKLRERQPRLNGKLRIGFAGGLSHSGDLAILNHAMQTIGQRVDWVFFGAKPENPPVQIEYHDGMPTTMYLDKLAQLDMDLLLAPLEDNKFNRCKSNLRLVETGSAGACVIAQDLTPYREGKPPVFAYAGTPEEWTAAIQKFTEAKPAERKRSADALRSWVGQHYVLERLIQKRMDAWLPSGPKWKPKPPLKHGTALVVSCADKEAALEQMPFLKRAKFCETGLEAACKMALDNDSFVLWVRPATSMLESSMDSMMAAMKSDPAIATVVPLATDGVNGFPLVDRWAPMSAHNVEVVTGIIRKVMPKSRLNVVAAVGPVVLLSHNALCMLGIPDVTGCEGFEEQAIMEWSLRSAVREWKQIQAADAFASSLAPPAQITQQLSTRLQARGTATRLQTPSEPVTPAQREAIELQMMKVQWGGPRPMAMGFAADYKTWTELNAALNDDGPAPFSAADAKALQVRHFGTAHYDEDAEWYVWVDNSITLNDTARAAFMSAIRDADSDVQVIYADHDSKMIDGNLSPEFKPDFDRELLMAQDYITPICAVRATRSFENRFELFEHVLEIGSTKSARAFVHIPKILGSMDVTARAEMAAMEVLGRQVIIQNMFKEAIKVEAHKHVMGCLSVIRDWRVQAKFPVLPPPLVSIIVPTLGRGRLIQPCVNTIRQHTGYPNYEIIIVQNGDERKEPELGAAASDPRVKVVHYGGKFNWSAINNFAINLHAKGDYIVTLNDDVCTGTRDWLDNMMGQAMQPDVGAVGARLLHPMGVVQHVGVVCHKGVAGHLHKGLPNGHPGHLGRAFLTHESAAVTGACMLFSRQNFERIGGFDEEMPRNYNDTDFCLRLRQKGLRNVVEMSAELLHPEGTSRGDAMAPDSLKLLQKENKILLAKHPEPDPYWNPNLQLGLAYGGMLIQGLNGEMLAWTDRAPTPDQERVLVINDKPGAEGISLDLIRQKAVAFAADLSGFTLKLTAPSLQNSAPLDIRDHGRINGVLKTMGIDRVILRSLIGTGGASAPAEALRCLDVLEMDVEINAIEDWMVRPVRDDGAAPNVFGFVDVAAWEQAYQVLMPLNKQSPDSAYTYAVTATDDEAAE